jgi:hypothetical protein
MSKQPDEAAYKIDPATEQPAFDAVINSGQMGNVQTGNGTQLNVAAINNSGVLILREVSSHDTQPQDLPPGHYLLLTGTGPPEVENVTYQGKQLLQLAEMMFHSLEEILKENEEALIPFYQNPLQQRNTHRRLIALFHSQRQRGKIGEWEAFLKTALERETSNEQIKLILEELYQIVIELRVLLYSGNTSRMIDEVKHIDKLSVVKDDAGGQYRSKRANKWDLLTALDIQRQTEHRLEQEKPNIENMVTMYLESLRNKVEKIGQICGKLRGLAW